MSSVSNETSYTIPTTTPNPNDIYGQHLDLNWFPSLPENSSGVTYTDQLFDNYAVSTTTARLGMDGAAPLRNPSSSSTVLENSSTISPHQPFVDWHPVHQDVRSAAPDPYFHASAAILFNPELPLGHTQLLDPIQSKAPVDIYDFLSSSSTPFASRPEVDFSVSVSPIELIPTSWETFDTSSRSSCDYPENGSRSDPNGAIYLPTPSTSTFHSSYGSSHSVTGSSKTRLSHAWDKRQGERSIVDSTLLQRVFTITSSRPDSYLRTCLDRILSSEFYQNNQLEPSQDSPEGEMITGQPSDNQHSIYRIFVDEKKTCLICGKGKGKVDRAVSCVRMHLGHRPYQCRGRDAGCMSCREGQEPARFFSEALRRDHTSSQIKTYECIRCGSHLRRGGMERHWKAMHRNEVFPTDYYSGYGKPSK